MLLAFHSYPDLPDPCARERHIDNTGSGFSSNLVSIRACSSNCALCLQVKLGPTLQPEVVLGGMLERLGDLLKCTRIVLIGCGSSFHACLSCRNTLERLTGKVVQCEVASDLLDRGALLGPSDACIFVSQSGETADTLQASVPVSLLSSPHYQAK